MQSNVKRTAISRHKLIKIITCIGTITNKTSQSFWALKDRLSSKQGAGVIVLQRPFFEVEVELSVPNIQMNPGL